MRIGERLGFGMALALVVVAQQISKFGLIFFSLCWFATTEPTSPHRDVIPLRLSLCITSPIDFFILLLNSQLQAV